MGDLIVLAILGVVVFFAARALYKKRKSGSNCCDGNCGKCGGCH